MSKNVLNFPSRDDSGWALDMRIVILAAIAIAGIYVALWVVGEAVWELSAKIDVLTTLVQSLQ